MRERMCVCVCERESLLIDKKINAYCVIIYIPPMLRQIVGKKKKEKRREHRLMTNNLINIDGMRFVHVYNSFFGRVIQSAVCLYLKYLIVQGFS